MTSNMENKGANIRIAEPSLDVFFLLFRTRRFRNSPNYGNI